MLQTEPSEFLVCFDEDSKVGSSVGSFHVAIKSIDYKDTIKPILQDY